MSYLPPNPDQSQSSAVTLYADGVKVGAANPLPISAVGGSGAAGAVTQSGAWNVGVNNWPTTQAVTFSGQAVALAAGSAAIGTVGVTALPALPAGANAIGTVGVTALPALPAGTNAIGSVVAGGRKSVVSVVPPVTAVAYAAGTVLGGVLTIPNAVRVAGGTGYKIGNVLTSKVTTYAGPCDCFFFSKLPSGSYANNAAFNLTAADAANLLGVRHYTDVTASGTGPAILRPAFEPMITWNNDTTPGTNIYCILVTRAAVTLASVSDLTLTLTMDLD